MAVVFRQPVLFSLITYNIRTLFSCAKNIRQLIGDSIQLNQ